MNDKFLSRKFILICVVQILLFLCLWCGRLPADVFQSITMVIVSGYILGNVAQRAFVKEN